MNISNIVSINTPYSLCSRLLPLYFLANFIFRRNLGSMPFVLMNLLRLAFLIPFRWALLVLLCAHVFFDCDCYIDEMYVVFFD